MLKIFIETINEIYNVVAQPIDSIYKVTSINKGKLKLNVGENESFGQGYFKLFENNKEMGVIYTPEEISNYIINNTVNVQDILENPFIKICDPASGCGNILIPCFNYLKKIYKENLEIINIKNNLRLKEKDIDNHIINNNLYAFDIDNTALKILVIDLFINSNSINTNNIFNKDFLIDNIEEKFDFFIGNPPYVGQKSVNRDYSLKLKEKYKGIYKDKGDISYCFFKSAIGKLVEKGKLGFITSRYFLESVSGEFLRKMLKEECSIYKIVDFYGIRPFKNVGIDPVIIFLDKEVKNEDIEVIKPFNSKFSNKKDFYKSIFLNKGNNYNKFRLESSLLCDSGWILIDKDERNIIKKIEEKTFLTLKDICHSNQGIITGCDKAFIIDSDTIYKENIELNIVKPWIKNSFIEKNYIDKKNSFIIYSNLIEDENAFPNAISHINGQKHKLVERRECKKGIRKWYELQWGREQSLFEGEKIIFPYKAKGNKFALDKGSYFSADIYSLIIKNNVSCSYESLLFLLNSNLYEFYFKTFAKKLGEDLYEYYPNNLMKLKIPNINEIIYDEESLYKFFNLNNKEIEIIEKSIKN